MCFRSGTWLSEGGRDVTASSQAPAAVITSPQSRQSVDADKIDNSPGNKWATATSNTGDVISTPSMSSVAVSELVDKGVLYLRDRIFNRDSGKNSCVSIYTPPTELCREGLLDHHICFNVILIYPTLKNRRVC